MSSSAGQRRQDKPDPSRGKVENKPNQPSPPSKNMASSNTCPSPPDKSILEELKRLRQENQDGHNHTKLALGRVEQTVSDIKGQLAEHEVRMGRMEERIGAAEDAEIRHQRALRYLLHRDIELSAKCDDMQNRLRRNNIRIFQIPEDSEGKDMAGFIKDLLQKELKLPPDLDIRIERAHRSLVAKPRDATAPPRSIIVRLLDAAVKDTIIKQAWSQGPVLFQGKRIYFDQDYSPDLQQKRMRVHEVIKQLKKKDIQARCLYPAQLRIKLNTGEKTFTSLTGAATLLRELGVNVRYEERERIEEELKDGWRSQEGRKRRAFLSTADFKALLQEGD